MACNVEKPVEIHNENGTRYEIGPDRDGLNLIEIRFRDTTGEIIADITFGDEVGKHIADAILYQISEGVGTGPD